MPLRIASSGSICDLSSFSSPMTGLAASWLSQKPVSPIFDSSSLRRFCLAGKSKRVPDGDHPGRKRFDRGREVFVNHELTLEAMSPVFKFQRETQLVLKI